MKRHWCSRCRVELKDSSFKTGVGIKQGYVCISKRRITCPGGFCLRCAVLVAEADIMAYFKIGYNLKFRNLYAIKK